MCVDGPGPVVLLWQERVHWAWHEARCAGAHAAGCLRGGTRQVTYTYTHLYTYNLATHTYILATATCTYTYITYILATKISQQLTHSPPPVYHLTLPLTLPLSSDKCLLGPGATTPWPSPSLPLTLPPSLPHSRTITRYQHTLPPFLSLPSDKCPSDPGGTTP